jgi:tetratricopeptide (TPR) repeat protein
VEQAHTWYIEDQEPPFAVSPDWRGVPFDTLTELVHQQHAEGALIYLLFRLKSALGSWRGEAAPSARYRIGVKGLTEAIAAHPTLKPALQATHQRLAQELLALLAPAPSSNQADATATEAVAMETATPSPVDALRLQYALAHAKLSGEAALVDALVTHSEYRARLWAMFNETYHQAHYLHAMQWATLGIMIRERALEAGGSAEQQNALAITYMNRGSAHKDQGVLVDAIADFNRAIDLREALRERLGEGWSAPLQNDLARAYMNRGEAYRNQWALVEAIADFNRAIDLGEGLRGQLGEAWSAPLQNDLAMAYSNRGLAHRNQGALEAAVQDYERAIRLWESLRAVLEPQGNWPKPWQGYLAQVQQAHQQVMGVLESQRWQRQFQEHDVQAEWRARFHQV